MRQMSFMPYVLVHLLGLQVCISITRVLQPIIESVSMVRYGRTFSEHVPNYLPALN
jgi:hypothetical protein